MPPSTPGPDRAPPPDGPATSAARTLRALMQRDEPLVMPGVYDALSARLAELAGFESAFVGGFSLVGARHALPDIGLASFGEVRDGVRDIAAATRLPLFVDIDNGYGDAKNAVRTVQAYERLGVAAVMIEDQVWPKRCGHLEGKQVVPSREMEAKLRAVCSERLAAETFVFARTDARAVLGIDEALRRAEAYLRAGADGLFVEAPTSVEELRLIGRSFDVPLIANPLEGGKTPILAPRDYFELGFRVLPYGLHLLMRVVRTMRDSLADLKSQRFEMAYESHAVPFADYLDMVGLAHWTAVEAAAAAEPPAA